MTKESFHISVEDARAFCLDVYRQLDVPEDENTQLTDSILDASLRGVDTHGILLNHIYAQRIRSGQMIPGQHLKIDKETSTTALGNACQGLGQVTSTEGMHIAMNKARDHGLGAVTIYNQSHNGALAYYIRMATDQNLIGLMFGNSTPRVAPFGGRSGLHGTNPIAFGIPGGKHPAMICDFATSASGGAIRQAVEDGVTNLPEGLALDPEGHPTTDPKSAFNGWLLPKGGTMGYGLALLADVLVGGLSGSNCGPDVPPVQDLDSPYACGSFMLVIDPDAFVGLDQFLARVAFLIESAQAIEPAEGFDRVRVPGERGEEEKSHRGKVGIPMQRKSWDQMILALEACKINIEPRWKVYES
jgi:LDH2 family malate/lactate/ureidoglycolate dehydrogenase